VDSVYLRILARNPKIRGHNVNLAQDSATVRQLVEQAQAAVSMDPKPELVLIQTVDADIVCPAGPSDYRGFGKIFVSAPRVLAHGAPAARIYVTSQIGRPTAETRMLAPLPDVRRQFGGEGPCDFFDPSGRLVPSRLARLEQVIRGYEAQLAAGCKRFARCHYDGGAFAGSVHRVEYRSPDWNHLTVRGHAEAAAVAWAALKRVGIIPG